METPPADGPVPPRAPPPPRGRSVSKPVRHRRWGRATVWVTLAGVAVVVAVAALLLFPGGDPKVESTLTEMGRIESEVRRHRKEHGTMPTRLSEIVGPGSTYHGDIVPEDAWRTPLEYRVVDAATGAFVLRSWGPDRAAGTPDDLVLPEGASWPSAPADR
jgi:hypothetical protein